MAEQKLRRQQARLARLQRYLPTLQLRKALLLAELSAARTARDALVACRNTAWDVLCRSAPLLPHGVNLDKAAVITAIDKGTATIAEGEGVSFQPFDYDLYDTPPWLDGVVSDLRAFRTMEVKAAIADERLSILKRELREVYIRVNVFEKVLIPRCIQTITSIKIFLDNRQLAALSEAKMIARKQLEEVS